MRTFIPQAKYSIFDLKLLQFYSTLLGSFVLKRTCQYNTSGNLKFNYYHPEAPSSYKTDKRIKLGDSES